MHAVPIIFLTHSNYEVIMPYIDFEVEVIRVVIKNRTVSFCSIVVSGEFVS